VRGGELVYSLNFFLSHGALDPSPDASLKLGVTLSHKGRGEESNPAMATAIKCFSFMLS
jgi:hypothetical protein